jgi:hypothetical protein
MFEFHYILKECTIIVIITIIIIIRYQLGLNRPVLASSNNLFKGLPSRFRPFGLHVSINFDIPLSFTLVPCRSQLIMIPYANWNVRGKAQIEDELGGIVN